MTRNIIPCPACKGTGVIRDVEVDEDGVFVYKDLGKCKQCEGKGYVKEPVKDCCGS